MESNPQVLSSGTTVVFNATAPTWVTRFSVTNNSASTATVNLYKVANGVSVLIWAKNYQLIAGASIIITDGVAVKAGQQLSVNTDQSTHVDINAQ